MNSALLWSRKKEKRDGEIEVELFRGTVAVELEDEPVDPWP